MLAMTPSTLVTAHRTGEEAVRVWDLETGRVLRSLKRPQLSKLGFGTLSTVESLPADRFLLRDEVGRAVLYDAGSNGLRAATPGAGHVAGPIIKADAAMVLTHASPSRRDAR